MNIHSGALGLPPIPQGEGNSIKKSLGIHLIPRLFLYWHDFFQKDRSAQFVEVRKTFHLQLIRYGFYLYVITKLIGEKGASPPLDKRVPAAVMSVQIVQSIKKTAGKLDFFEFVYSLS
ncbi:MULTISPECIES: hypothetical protein [unclassified Bacillus (in: firmicutes)]|uniref:hypothetical protein n=1 Tax=unclassified Bacillus (in: firmicutes) TaxID=185979 RepID=UPI001BEA27A6|nr:MULTISPECIES: hypothetical protein [unclassified Bacillus (in: firmicutes)]MBT2614950.1 hypothetical protein [Bacillus sp. ISL-78]MBT2627567.1 hypothetical protein [Bacillus sp. ISL-101]